MNTTQLPQIHTQRRIDQPFEAVSFCSRIGLRVSGNTTDGRMTEVAASTVTVVSLGGVSGLTSSDCDDAELCTVDTSRGEAATTLAKAVSFS